MPDVIVEAVGPHVLADGARRHERGGAFLREEVVDLALFLQRLLELVFFVPERLRRVREALRRRIDLAFLLLELLVGQPLRFRLEADVRRIGAAVHDDGAAQLAAVLLEIVLRLHLDDDRRAGQRRGERRRPGARVAGDPHVLRLGHLDREAIDRPAAAGGPVRLERGVRQAPAGQLIARPLARLMQRRRSGQPRAVDIGNPAERVHHRRSLKRLGLDLGDDGFVDRFLRERRHRGGQEQAQGDRRPPQRALPLIGRILRGRTFGAPAAIDQHEARLERRIVAGGIGMQRIARQQQHAVAVLLDRLRHAADDGAPPRPRQRVLHRLERLDLAQRAPGRRRQDDLLASSTAQSRRPAAPRGCAWSRCRRAPASDAAARAS